MFTLVRYVVLAAAVGFGISFGPTLAETAMPAQHASLTAIAAAHRGIEAASDYSDRLLSHRDPVGNALGNLVSGFILSLAKPIGAGVGSIGHDGGR